MPTNPMKAAIAIFFTIILSACASPSQLYWDYKVKELCNKDGGVTVYEHIELTPEEYVINDGKNGFIQVWPEKTSPAHHQYADKSVRTKIHRTDPEVWRTEYTTYRKSDGKALGLWVTYTRRGGDLIAIDNESNFSCSDIPGFENNPTKEIFSVKKE